MDEIERFLSFSYGYDYGRGFGNGDGYDYGRGFGNGDGYGYGRGFGNGDGDGEGYGDGDGEGYSNGCGYGDGDGKGYGYGRGYGYGNGCGYGYGDGDGEGYGNGCGIEEINGHKVYLVDDVPTVIYSVHGNYASGATIRFNSILEPCYIAKAGSSFAHGRTLHDAQRDAVAKELQNVPVEERVKRVKTQYPDPDVKIPNADLYSLHNLLTGSCALGRSQFAESHGIDIENGSMTMREFIELTKDAYGSDAIRLLAREY